MSFELFLLDAGLNAYRDEQTVKINIWLFAYIFREIRNQIRFREESEIRSWRKNPYKFLQCSSHDSLE